MKKNIVFGLFLLSLFTGSMTYALNKNLHALSHPAKVITVDRDCNDWRSRYRMNHVRKCELEKRDKYRKTREYKSEILRNRRPKLTYVSRARRLKPMRNRISPRIKRTTTQKDYYSHIGLRSSSVKSNRRTAMRMRSRGYSSQLRTNSQKNYSSHYQWKKRK